MPDVLRHFRSPLQAAVGGGSPPEGVAGEGGCATVSNPNLGKVGMFEEYFEEFRNEVHRILGAYFFWRMIHNRIEGEPDFLRAVNEAPLSWMVIRHSLQVTLFITLGRVFDLDVRSFSADDLLRSCITDLALFDKDHLRGRKICQNGGGEPEWLDEYIKKAHQPTEREFKRLRGALTLRRKVFDRMYRPIRHQLIAHADKEMIGRGDELWKNTNIEALENIIWFLHDLKETLQDVYDNGKPPNLRNLTPNVAFYEDDCTRLLDMVRDSGNELWARQGAE
jgi:hypothetical protein